MSYFLSFILYDIKYSIIEYGQDPLNDPLIDTFILPKEMRE